MKDSIQAKINELRVSEQTMQSILAQRQSFEMESNEINNALEEVKKSTDEIYKMVSNVMIKAEKSKVLSELEEKQKLSKMRISAMEKQEKSIEDNIRKLREEIEKEQK